MMDMHAFKKEDYSLMKCPEEVSLNRWTSKNLHLQLQAIEDVGTFRTLKYNNKIFAIYGMIELWEGVCEVVFLPSVDWEEHRKEILRIVRKECHILTKLFHRVQMTCVDKPKFKRFARFFGFKEDGRLLSYDRFKQDYIMWSIVQGGVT